MPNIEPVRLTVSVSKENHLPIPLSPEDAVKVWLVLADKEKRGSWEIFEDAELGTDFLTPAERALYDLLTLRITNDAQIVSITEQPTSDSPED